MLNIEKTVEGTNLTVKLEGRLDTTTAPKLEEEINASLAGMNSVVLDFEKLEYISSAGLRIVLSVHKKMLKAGGLKVIHVNETIMDIFEVTGFTDLLTIE